MVVILLAALLPLPPWRCVFVARVCDGVVVSKGRIGAPALWAHASVCLGPQVLKKEKLAENAEKLGHVFRDGLNSIKDQLGKDQIKLVRGKGLLNAMIIEPRGTPTMHLLLQKAARETCSSVSAAPLVPASGQTTELQYRSSRPLFMPSGGHGHGPRAVPCKHIFHCFRPGYLSLKVRCA